MMNEVEIEREILRKVLKRILRKDERKNNSVLSIEMYGKRNKINNRLTAGCGPISIKEVKNDLIRYSNDMKDYSHFSSDGMVLFIKKMLEEKGYKNVEVSRLMNMSDSGVSGAMSQKTRVTLINIYEFVSGLVPKSFKKIVKEENRKEEVKGLRKNVNASGRNIVAKLGKMYLMEFSYKINEGKMEVAVIKLTTDSRKAKPFYPALDTNRKETYVEQIGAKFVELKEVTTFIEEELV